jgi:SpoVK/Ycf46/Vps4 family AAA+-type ATPase
MDKRLYVFEEIDCGGWQNILQNRVVEYSKKKKKSDVQTIIKSMKKKDNDDTESEVSDDDDAINLGSILEILDGIDEMPGRMTIFTTNHPNMLDPALIRPGRIDMNVEFLKMKRQDINDMYKLWFGEDLPQDVLLSITDFKFTQADIGKLFKSLDKDKIYHSLKM